MAIRNPTIVTTSWDDGDPQDSRLADLLLASDLPGTFYIPLNREPGLPRLSSAEIHSLALAGFEVGAHTVSHRTLTQLRPEEIRHEIHESKSSLEQLLGREVSAFCYPRGRYNWRILREVKNAGFGTGRTTRMLSVSLYFHRLAMPTTVQVYPHRGVDYVKNLARGKSVSGLIHHATHLRRFEKWTEKGRVLFDEVLRNGGLWHLYGHSWEIEELGLWDELKEMLGYVSNREGVIYATNSEVQRLREVVLPQELARCPN